MNTTQREGYIALPVTHGVAGSSPVPTAKENKPRRPKDGVLPKAGRHRKATGKDGNHSKSTNRNTN